MGKIRIMFDANIYNKIAAHLDLIKLSEVCYEYYTSPIQEREIADIPKNKKILKEFLEHNKAKLDEIMVEHYAFMFNQTPFNQYPFVDSDTHNHIHNENPHHLEDAHIACYSNSIDAILVTEDKRLRNKQKELGWKATSLEEFIKELEERRQIFIELQKKQEG